MRSKIAGSFLGALLLCAPVQAASLYWDSNGDGIDSSYGGNGTWSGTDANWNTSATIGSGGLQAWTGGAADTASFLRGTSGTVTVSGTQIVKSLNFGGSAGSFTTGTAAYTLTGGVLDIRQTSFAFTISTSAGGYTIDSGINLFSGAASGNTQRFDMNSNLTVGGIIQDVSGVSGTHNLQLEGYNGVVNSLNGDITKSTGSTGITLTVGGGGTANNANYSLGGNNTGLAGVLTLNRGTLTLNNSNALSGAGSLTVANANAGGADTANLLIGAAGVTINKGITYTTLGTDTTDVRMIGGSNTSGTSTFSGGITLGAFAATGTGSSLQVTAATGGTTVFSGAINDGANTVALTKNGAGIVKFTRAAGNTYDGTTAVSVGTLLINNTSNSGTGTGAISVASGATFGGTGLVTGAITVAAGGKFSAGDMDTAGVSTADSFDGTSFTLSSNNSTASMLFDLGSTSDLLTLSGAFTKGSGTNFIFNFENAGGLTTTTYTLINFASTSFVLGDLGYTSSNGSFAGNFIVNATNLQFQVTAIPEPSTYALFGMGLAGLWVLRRRKSQA